MVNRRFIDLNSKFIEIGGSPLLGKEPRDEFWQNDFRSTDGLHFFGVPISLLCRTLQRSLQSQKLFLLGSVSHLSVCSTDLSRKSQRHRGVSSHHTAKALSHGNSQHRLAQHSGQRQSSARLAHLRRLCSDPDPRSTFSLPRANPSDSNSTIPSTPWTLPPSICVCRFSHGHSFADASPPSNCTLCSICAAVFPRW
jgi:hypothetical protein